MKPRSKYFNVPSTPIRIVANFYRHTCTSQIADGDGPLFFDRGAEGIGTLLNANIFLNAAPATNNFFVSPSFCKHFFFTCIQFISVFTASANNLFPNFPPPPRSVKKLIQIVRPLEAREKEDHVVRGFMSLTQLLCVLCGRLHISTTANLATQKVPVVDRWPLWRGICSWEGLGGRGV